MFFQVDFPTQKAKPQKKVQLEPEEVPVLSVAPFTSIPKVCFDNVAVGTSVSKTLIVHNPTTNNIMLHITKAPPDERCFCLSWAQCMLHSHEKVELELFWQAKAEGAWTDTLIFEDGYRLKKVVGIIFKAIIPKKAKVKPKKVVKCVSTKVKSPKKWFSPKQKLSLIKSPKSMVTRAALPDITNIPQIYVNSPKNSLIESNSGATIQNSYVIKNKENFEISGIENLSFASSISTTPNHINTKKYYSDTLEVRNNGEENFEDSLEIRKDSVDFAQSFRMHELSQGYKIHETPLGIEDKLKAITFTPVNNFQPSLCSTGEKTQYLDGDNALDGSNLSSGTYNIDKRSPGSNIEEKLSNISSSTYIKETYSSSTFTKEGILAELTFSSSPSPVPFEINNQKDNIVHHIESNYNFEAVRPRPYLEQILEESYVSFNASSINTIETRKRRSENCAPVISPKRISKGASNFETSVHSGLPRRSFSQKRGLNLREVINKTRENVLVEEEVTVHSRTLETSTKFEVQGFSSRDPFILTATNSIDPFMSSTMYYDPKWVDEQEKSFKKWLNALLTPPEELNSNAEGAQVNVVKLWQDCKNREVSKAPTKEVVSNKYHTRSRLQSLRRTANNFFRSPAISDVLAKICNMVENQKLVIRTDKDVHLDLGLQTEIISLFLSYNPLWLRIGLETIYNMPIPLHSNSDVIGLAMFLSENFFKDRYLLKKYKSVHTKKYAIDIKKMILKKFFMLIFFLDKAKENKLIPHDPCLFCKNSSFKESRDIILRFSRELLSSIGDVTKIVKYAGYVLTHKQTYIHEFDFAVNNLGADLRDGVRLAKVTEIILVVEGLMVKLRTPAISRLQKVHNMKMVFDALQKSGFTILHDIEPKDIVDGHREKTLSFLWQIIYKFQAPRIKKAVITIQAFWRSLRIVIKRKILQRERLRREQAALKIQRWYKRILLSRMLDRIIPVIQDVLIFIKKERAAKIVQKNLRMMLARRRFSVLRNTIIGLQSYIRRFLVLENINIKAISVVKIQANFRMYLARKRFLKLKASVRLIEEVYAAKKTMKIDSSNYQKLKFATLYVQSKFRAKTAMKRDMQLYAQMKWSAILIQNKFRACKLMRAQRTYYLDLKGAAILLQQRCRANKNMVVQRKHYQQLRSSVILIQQYVRAKQQMIRERNAYETLKRATCIIQAQFRANMLMKQSRIEYLRLTSAVKYIQIRYRAKIAMKNQNEVYLKMKQSAIVLQTRFRAMKLMQEQRASYQNIKRAVVVIQKRYRAKKLGDILRKEYLQTKLVVKAIEERVLATKLMRKERQIFLDMKKAVCVVAERYIARKLAKKESTRYKMLRQAILTVQERFRANRQMKINQEKYLLLKKATVFIQRQFRANSLAKVQRNNYLQLKKSSEVIQIRYRAFRLMKVEYFNFVKLKKAIMVVQQRYRANRLARLMRSQYINLKRSVRIFEERYKAKKLACEESQRYAMFKQATVVIQRRFRANSLMKEQRALYLEYRNSVTIIQLRFRANRLAKTHELEYIKLRSTAIIVQRTFRANQLIKLERSRFQELKKATLTIQRRFRAMQLGCKVRLEYLKMKNSVRTIEDRYRAMKLAKIELDHFQTLKRSTITIQRQFRANELMKSQRNDYLSLKKSAVVIQTKFRANQLARTHELKYKKLKNSSIIIQRIFRANQMMKSERNNFLEYRKATVTVQRRFRAMKLANKVRSEYLKMKNSVRIMEERYTAMKLTKIELNRFQTLKRYTMSVQRQYRANELMKSQRNDYLLLKKSAIVIQTKFRANRLARRHELEYKNLKKSAIIIQQIFRANQIMKLKRNSFLEFRKATTTIQRRFRATQRGRIVRLEYLKMKNSVRIMEERYRARKLAKIESNRFQTLKRYTTIVQRQFRANELMKAQRNYYLSLKKAAVFIQTKFRANKLSKFLRSNYLKHRNSSIVIQRRYRAFTLMKLERSNFLQLRTAVLFVQVRFLAIRNGQRERSSYLRLKSAVRTIENRYEAKLLCRKQFDEFNVLKKTVNFVQRRYRAKCLMRNERERFLKLKETTIMIQRRFRAIKTMKTCKQKYEILRNSVVCIQSKYRANKLMRIERDRYKSMYDAIVKIQRIFRAKLMMKIESHNYKKMRKAIVAVQRRYRAKKLMEVEKNKFAKLKMAVKTIESRYIANKLMRQEQTRYENLKKAASYIQNRYRNAMQARKLRRDYLTLRKVVEFVQRRFRSNKQAVEERRRYLTLIKSVVLIQRLWRIKLAYRKRMYNITIVQAFVRGFLARKWFSHKHLPVLLERRKKIETERKAATKIQACWRGYRTRSLDKLEMSEIRRKAKIACDKATVHESLAYKKERALNIMISQDSTIDQIIAALQDLAYETRLFKQSCIDLSECLPEELYRMISTSSRSLPEMHACTAATDILVNFCKHPTAIDNCWFPKNIDSIFTVMIHWCDKDCQLFVRLCTLIWHLAQDKRRKRIIKNIPGLSQKLAKIKQLCDRKHKMSLRLKNKGADIFCVYHNLPTPSLEPDWGLDYKHKPRTFKNALHALHSVLNVLDIPF